jgi:hypothetical protein
MEIVYFKLNVQQIRNGILIFVLEMIVDVVIKRFNMDVSKLMNVRLNMVIVFSKLSAQLT